MQISGYLPAPALPTTLSAGRQYDNKTATQNFPDANTGNARRQTVEYVFDAEVIDDNTRSPHARNEYRQIIDPANQSAISRYTEMQVSAPTAGRLLDIFI